MRRCPLSIGSRCAAVQEVEVGGPIQKVLELSQKGVCGEMICATASVEVHVFLQSGRVAWATDSSHPFAFGQRIQESASIDERTFRQVVEECRRERLPLGETLVEWGLASWDGVRDALRHQIQMAFSLLRRLPDAQTIFLQRTYSEYDPTLTFSVDDFLHAEDAESMSLDQSAPISLNGKPGLARQLRQTVEGLSWVEILSAGAVLDRDPREGPEPAAPRGVCDSSICDGADFVAIRSARGSIVGLQLPGDASLWCQLNPASTFGAVVSALWALTADSQSPPRSTLPSPPTLSSLGSTEQSTFGQDVLPVLARAPEIRAVLRLSPETRDCQGYVDAALDSHWCVDISQRRAPCLGDCSWLSRDPDTLNSIGFYLKTMVSGEGALWCFGAELQADVGGTLWLFIDRSTSQGLGWAYLSALTRNLSRASRLSRPAAQLEQLENH